MENEIEISCPYCGEINVIEIDITEGLSQTFVQDCEVCCRPVELNISIDRNSNISIEVRNEEGF
jgi:uncharacterized Zn finger protein